MVISTGKVLSINTTHVVHEGDWTGSEGRTGIDKRPSPNRVAVKNEGVEGDVIADRKHHGGYHQAVYAYAHEDLIWWEGELGTKLTNGKFGENLTTSGIDVTHAVIGQRWAIGSSLLEVSQPRIPCRVFAGFWGRPTLIKDFTRVGRPGAYLRIIREGDIGAGDAIEIVHSPSHGITISDLFSAKSGDRSLIAEIAIVPEISISIRDWAEKILKFNNKPEERGDE